MKKGLWGWGTFVEMAIFGGGHTAEWTKVTGLADSALWSLLVAHHSKQMKT